MQPRDFFHHCPRCGAGPGAAPTAAFRCDACGFRLYFNPAVAVAVFIRRDDGRTLFIHRAQEPGKGLLAPPGGFIDIGERAEEAAHREIGEEVGLGLEDLTFLCSQTNAYRYAEVTYPVLDLFFTARARNAEGAAALDDVLDFEWLDPLTVSPGQMAFPSMQAALALWQERLRHT